MRELTRIKIEDRVYSVMRFNPMDGMEFGTKLLSVIAPSMGGIVEATKEGGDPGKVGAQLAYALKDPSLTPLLRQAFKQCFTPQNESLEDEAVFNKWFAQHPGDMFSLGAQAMWVLVKDFLPSQLTTIVGDFQLSSSLSNLKTA